MQMIIRGENIHFIIRDRDFVYTFIASITYDYPTWSSIQKQQ